MLTFADDITVSYYGRWNFPLSLFGLSLKIKVLFSPGLSCWRSAPERLASFERKHHYAGTQKVFCTMRDKGWACCWGTLIQAFVWRASCRWSPWSWYFRSKKSKGGIENPVLWFNMASLLLNTKMKLFCVIFFVQCLPVFLLLLCPNCHVLFSHKWVAANYVNNNQGHVHFAFPPHISGSEQNGQRR